MKCKCCEKVYVGQTGRSFKERIKELKKAIGAYETHLNQKGHSFDNDVEILQRQKKGQKLNKVHYRLIKLCIQI